MLIDGDGMIVGIVRLSIDRYVHMKKKYTSPNDTQSDFGTVR